MPPDLVPPVAPARPTRRELHGVAWTDEYAWMREQDEALMQYLRAERSYYDRATRHLADLSHTLFREVKQRLLPADESVRFRRGDLFYYTRSVAGSEYEQFLSSRDPTGPGRVLLDEAELGITGGFVAIGLREVSPDATLLAYSVDTTGDEVYELRFRDLSASLSADVSPALAAPRDLTPGDDRSVDGRVESVARTYYGGAWSADSTTFFYTVHDGLFRPYQVWRHQIGTSPDTDVLVFTEADARFEITVRASTDQAYVVIECASRDTSETWLVPAAQPQQEPVCLRPRRAGMEYHVDHGGDGFVIVTNDEAEEFQLEHTPIISPQWTSMTPPRAGERISACHVLREHLVVELRRDGFPLLRIVEKATAAETEITADMPAGCLTLHPQLEYGSATIVVCTQSLVEPLRWERVDLRTGARTLEKLSQVPGYDPSSYRTERRHAPGPDGTPVPVTLAWRAGTPLDGSAPCLMWGYGAYESCDDPEFDEALPSLLDRGVVYALTHPRGGGEMGRAWWTGGRLAAKTTTFADHEAVAGWLASTGIVDGSRIATRGLSAGGLLQGAVFSRCPQRWRAVVAEVPFVDVVTSMLDPSIPLTINEWDEWGDPRQPELFALMRGYSPYDNVPTGVARPALLVTAAVHDPRVLVHEPAKWVARLRATASPADGPLLFRPELGAGAHTGPTGRYAHYRYECEILAFVLDQLTAPDGAVGTAPGTGPDAAVPG